jgi:hypothetical protein
MADQIDAGADRDGARLTGVHVIPPLDVPPYYKPHAIERVAANPERFHREDAAGAEALFTEITAGRPTPSDWQMLNGPLSARLCGLE